MIRLQILLDTKEIRALRREALQSGKSCSHLVREAIDTLYISRFTDAEAARMAGEARRGKGTRKFKNLQDARRYLYSRDER